MTRNSLTRDKPSFQKILNKNLLFFILYRAFLVIQMPHSGSVCVPELNLVEVYCSHSFAMWIEGEKDRRIPYFVLRSPESVSLSWLNQFFRKSPVVGVSDSPPIFWEGIPVVWRTPVLEYLGAFEEILSMTNVKHLLNWILSPISLLHGRESGLVSLGRSDQVSQLAWIWPK